MANIFYQKLKCMLSVASNVYLIKLILQLHMNKKSNLLLGFLFLYFCTEFFLNFATKMHYVWQGVIVAISQQIRDIKIAVNLHYVCQGTKRLAHFIGKFLMSWMLIGQYKGQLISG